MTETHDTNDNTGQLPEARRETLRLYEEVMGNICQLSESARTELAKLMGVKPKHFAREYRANTDGIQDRIVDLLAQKQVGIKTILDTESRKDRDPSDIQIDYNGSGSVDLGTIIRNPRSEDAQLVAFLFNNVFSRPADQVALRAAFERVTDVNQISNFQTMLRIRKIYDELEADKEYLDLGDKGRAEDKSKTPPVDKIDRSGKIGEQANIYDEAKEAKDDLFKTKPPFGDKLTAWLAENKDELSDYNATMKSARTEQKRLEEKRKQLKTHLQEIGVLTGKLVGTHPTYTFDDKHTQDFKGAATINSGCTADDLTFASTNESLGNWLSDKDNRNTFDRLKRMNDANGPTGTLDARHVLHEMVRIHYGDKASDDANRESFINEMHGLITSKKGLGRNTTASGSSESGSESSASVSSGEKKEGWGKWLAKEVGYGIADAALGLVAKPPMKRK